jgi:hypothetical protein
MLKKSIKLWIAAVIVAAIGFAGLNVIALGGNLSWPLAAAIQIMRSKKTVEDRVKQYGDAVRTRLAPLFTNARVTYPPRRVTLVGIKDERMLQVWVSGDDGDWIHLCDYPILGMSGTLGPKLKEGDRQVPEGIYRVESLNPNSLYHLALRVNYPNSQDILRGQQDGRSTLGSDIMIHGKTCSIGCLAMGDQAAEDLFILTAETGIENVSIILSPVDFRTRGLPDPIPILPPWTGELYDAIKQELAKLEGI